MTTANRPHLPPLSPLGTQAVDNQPPTELESGIL
jgi:hypothetical protein